MLHVDTYVEHEAIVLRLLPTNCHAKVSRSGTEDRLTIFETNPQSALMVRSVALRIVPPEQLSRSLSAHHSVQARPRCW